MYRRRYYPLPQIYKSYNYKSGKYSNETVAFNTQLTEDIDGNKNFPYDEENDKSGIRIIPATNIMGNRKVKNFTLKLTANNNDDQIFGALVYVPEGTKVSQLLVGGEIQSIYEPNQNVIATFIIPPNCVRNTDKTLMFQSAPTQITVSNKLARNLNTGDCICLVFASPNGIIAGDGSNGAEPCTVSGTINFAIKY